ncbi:hypothetical protein M3Y94_00824700 [Aphelenchoides besseyi]|nr:hypothetical protein M3Y94_00824700 [Aphelenchoides besseyi]
MSSSYAVLFLIDLCREDLFVTSLAVRVLHFEDLHTHTFFLESRSLWTFTRDHKLKMIAGKINVLLDNIRNGFRSVIPVVILVAFTIVGAAIFMTIEGPNELYELKKLRDERAKLLEDTAFRLNTIKHMQPIEAYNHTVDTLTDFRNELGVQEVHLNETKWTFVGSIYFALTVYTTIGYGNIVCHTTTGRILTVCYGLIGIPLALISLVALGSLFAKGCMIVWKFIVRTFGCFSKDFEQKVARLTTKKNRQSEETEAEEDDDEELLNFPIGFLIFLTILWILFCAYILLLWEEHWTYGTSLYFVLVSFLTIGFGDVLVSKPKYIIPFACLLLIGLALVSTVLTLIQKQIEALASGMKDSIDKEYLAALQQAEDEAEAEETVENGADVETGKKKAKKGPKKPKEKKPQSLEQVISRMPLRSRVLYHIMPAKNKKGLAKHAEKREQVGTKAVQTDPWLMDSAGGAVENINY